MNGLPLTGKINNTHEHITLFNALIVDQFFTRRPDRNELEALNLTQRGEESEEAIFAQLACLQSIGLMFLNVPYSIICQLC